MALAEKMISAKFFAPEDLERLQMTEDGTVVESPPRKNSVFRSVTWGFLIGLVLLGSSYYLLYERGLIAHPNVQMQRIVTFVEGVFLRR